MERGIEKYILPINYQGIESKDVISEKIRIGLDLVKDMVSVFKATQQIDVNRLKNPQ